MFIAIYGINNIGKSTQTKMLVEYLELEGKKTKLIKYPLYDLPPTGPQINYFLRDPKAPKISPEELQRLYVFNRLDAEPHIRKALSEGYTIVAEDYTGTGIAWGMVHGVNKSLLESMNKDLLREDLAILLDGVSQNRSRETQHLNEGNDELLKKSREIHLQLAKEYGWHIVNANRDKQAVFEDIKAIVEQAL